MQLRGGGDPAGRHPAPPRGGRTAAPHPAQQRQPVVRRTAWVAKAQEEHDAFAAVLASRGVEVLLLADLLTEHSPPARPGCTASPPPSMPADWGSHWPKSFRPTCAPGRRHAGACADRRDDLHRVAVGGQRVVAGAPHAPRCRLRHRPTAQPDVHQGLVVLDRTADGDHLAGAAGTVAGIVADRSDLRPSPPASWGGAARLRIALRTGRRWRCATAAARGGGGRGGG